MRAARGVGGGDGTGMEGRGTGMEGRGAEAQGQVRRPKCQNEMQIRLSQWSEKLVRFFEVTTVKWVYTFCYFFFSLCVVAIKLNVFTTQTHTHTHMECQFMCVCCLSKLVRHIYAMSMDSFGLHLHREIISCIAMPIHLSATPTPVHTNTHTRTQLICLFLWHIQGKSALLPRAES